MFYTLKFKSLLIFALLLTAASTSLSLLGELRGGEEAVSVSAAGSGAVLIIDAGHGGLDGGAVGADGTVESGVNLDIALKLAALAAFCGQESVLTRDSEELHYPDEDASIASKKTADQRRRLELINSVPGGVLISIHQNKYTAPQPSGPQVFYNGSGLSSDLAGLTQEKLNTELASGGRRVSATAAFSMMLAQAMESDEPTMRNSNLLPVKAKGEVRLRSVVSRVKRGRAWTPSFMMVFSTEL